MTAPNPTPEFLQAIEVWKQRCFAAESDLAKAREVIRPFAAVAAHLDYITDTPLPDNHQVRVALGDLRAARAFQGEK